MGSFFIIYSFQLGTTGIFLIMELSPYHRVSFLSKCQRGNSAEIAEKTPKHWMHKKREANLP